jgi:hypothetical protein
MALRTFEQADLKTVSDALDIAEDATGDFYKFSTGQWKRHSYDIMTLSSLRDEEANTSAFAMLNKGMRVLDGFESRTRLRDFYFICLQDNYILEALKRDEDLELLPLLVYVLTHELVHIVRFCNFHQRFDVSEKEKEKEEKVVHSTTFEILKDFSMSKLDYILDSYQHYRICDRVLS